MADALTQRQREILDFISASIVERGFPPTLREGGHLIVTEALQAVHTATTVRVRGGKLSTTDGPFAETKETLGGIFLIEARDRDEALRLAAAWPSARIGSIEVRPIEESLPTDRRYAMPSRTTKYDGPVSCRRSSPLHGCWIMKPEIAVAMMATTETKWRHGSPSISACPMRAVQTNAASDTSQATCEAFMRAGTAVP